MKKVATEILMHEIHSLKDDISHLKNKTSEIDILGEQEKQLIEDEVIEDQRQAMFDSMHEIKSEMSEIRQKIEARFSDATGKLNDFSHSHKEIAKVVQSKLNSEGGLHG